MEQNDSMWLRDKLDSLATKIEDMRIESRDLNDKLREELRLTYVAKVEFHPELKTINDRLENLEGKGGLILSRTLGIVAVSLSAISTIIVILQHAHFN